MTGGWPGPPGRASTRGPREARRVHLSGPMAQTMRRRLQQLRESLLGRLQALRRGGMDEAMADSLGELSAYDQHTADLGSETFERSKDLALLERAELTLDEVERALRRMDEGSYGSCEACGRFIGYARLLALPYARRCAACQAEHDRWEQERRLESRSVGKRPLEEAALMPPFGRGNRASEGADPGLRGEDIWQMVARYGTANTPQDIPGAVDYDEVWEGADTEEAGGTQEVEFVADVTGSGVVDPTQVYPDPAGAGRRRPTPPEEEEKPDVP